MQSMKSPKFQQKKKDLEEVINVPRLKSRWKDKVREAMRRQPLPDPLEHLDFHVRLEFACTELMSEVMSGVYAPKSPLRLLSEKSKGLCRQLVVPSVNDALLLQTLSDALWEEIKTKAPSHNAKYAPSDHGFAKIIKGQSSDYGPVGVWLAFQKSIFGFTERKAFIVATDIANLLRFYFIRSS